MTFRSGKITGVVVDAATGRPTAGATVIVKWVSYFVHGKGDVCIKATAVRASDAGRFEIPAWSMTSPWGETVVWVATPYARGWSMKGSASKADRRITPFNDIRIPATDVRIEMARFQGSAAERLNEFRILFNPLRCAGVDDPGAKDLYLALREELVAMAPEISNFSDGGRLSPLQLVDRELKNMGVAVADLPQVPVVTAPRPRETIPAMTPPSNR